ncbi:hypothetical protein [Yersinia ruckeri]|uniref:hypothetical protein n=2 Tax=Yersinia ruckeri TaxID=29486 RepID=UPI0020BFD1B6|nr:hypothetical protein [Yersinia ruckeri]MCK8583656.1 hypothetical protein [Yersinia ruckeri]
MSRRRGKPRGNNQGQSTQDPLTTLMSDMLQAGDTAALGAFIRELAHRAPQHEETLTPSPVVAPDAQPHNIPIPPPFPLISLCKDGRQSSPAHVF